MAGERAGRRRIAAPRLSYTTKVHLKRRLMAVDFRFLAAVAALALAAAASVRYL